MVTDYIQPLDLEHILLDTFLGSSALFVFVAIIFIAILSARFRMQNSIMMIMFGLFVILGAVAFSLGEELYVFVLIIAGMAITYAIARLLKY